MRIRSFIIAYALVLAILLFADRRPSPVQQDRYSHVVDLTDGQNSTANSSANSAISSVSRTHIIAPGTLIPGTWTAAQIPAERLIAPLIVMDVSDSPLAQSQISLNDIAQWETRNGAIPQGAIVAIRKIPSESTPVSAGLPITAEAAEFLMDARYTTGFAMETAADFGSDRTLPRQLALHGNYVVEGTSPLKGLPATGSLIIIAPSKNKATGPAPVRVLAMVK